ncbi:MAG: hypothetical protein AB7I79_04390 [Rhizobiaceae bacterium]
MADFVAVLKKTIDGLGETTPDMRQRVYDKARATVDAKLAAISPPPLASVADRQRRSLEDAIAQIEAEFAPDVGEPADPLDRLQNIFPSLGESSVARPAYTAPVRKSWETPPARPLAGSRAEMPRAEMPAEAEELAATTSGFSPALAGETVAEPDSPDMADEPDVRPRRGAALLIAAGIAAVLMVGGGYAVWLNKDDFAAMLGMGDVTVAEQPAETVPVETAAETPDTPPESVERAADQPVQTKFTQRLEADGTETDEGPAGGEAMLGEGTSVASVTQPPVAPETAPPAALAEDGDTAASAPEDGQQPPADAAATAPETAPADTVPGAVAVAQRAIFYEERTSVAQGSAETGSIVWSVVQESPGGDLPPEPAIRAEATIPAKDLQVTMTIKRNGDRTLPFSHMIELIFLTPDNFDGGGIENILRFALKDTEEAPGSSIIGTPAKIAEGFFLVALSDTPAEIDANLGMLRQQGWIDIPIIYKSGRRALVTMEKGVPGSQVFDDVLKAWQSATAG